MLFLRDLRALAIYFSRDFFGNDAFGLGLLQLDFPGFPALSAPLGVDEEWPPRRFFVHVLPPGLMLPGIMRLR